MSDNKILATIYGEQITEDVLDSYIAKLPDEQQRYATNPAFRSQVLDQIINMKVLYKYAKDNELEKTVRFEELLEAVKTDILTQLAVQSIMDEGKTTEEEVKAYYEANPDEFKSEEYVAAKHILVDDEAKANEIMAEINAGSKSFEDAAKEYSSCPSKERGGDLGRFGHGQMVPEFDKAAFAAEVNQIVGPVQTQFGYHLIQVYDKKNGELKSFDEVKDSLTEMLTKKARRACYDAKLNELREVGLK